MGQIKNIKLHIVTILRLSKWANIPLNPKTRPNHAKHEVPTSACTSRTHEKQLKPSRRCTSGRPTDTSRMWSPRSRSFHSDDSTEVLAAKHKPKLTDALKEDGPSSPLNSCCSF